MGRGCFLRGFGGFTKIIVIFAGSEGGDRVTVVGYFLIVPGKGNRRETVRGNRDPYRHRNVGLTLIINDIHYGN